MKFVKRLIIMSGENKGTLTIEKNAAYVSAKFNSFGKSVSNGALIVLVDGKKYHRKLNGDKESFSLEIEGELNSVHAAVFCAEKLVMYGTNEPKRLDFAQINALLPQKKAYVLPLADNQALLDKIFSSRTGAAGTGAAVINTAREDTAALSGHESAYEPIYQSLNEPAQEYIDDAVSEINYYPPEYSATQDLTQDMAQNMPQEFTQDTHQDVVQELAAEIRQETTADMPKKAEGECVMDELPSSKCSKYLRLMRENYAPKPQEHEYESAPEHPAYKPEYAHLAKPEYSAFKKEPDFKKEPYQKEFYQKDYARMPDYEPVAEVAASGLKKFNAEQPKFNPEKLRKEIHIAAREGTFYERCGDDIEKIFAQSEHEKDLEEVLPGSKWVRIEYNESGKFYVMGIIGKEYLCYGVPADFTPVPPEELKGYCWWLPLKPDKPKAKGYWIMYQSLKTGEAVLPST